MNSINFINRELSWLSFNIRVLEEASNISYPLFERVKFLSISAENLDEFFMVRVAGLWGQVQSEVKEKSIDGLTASEQLNKVWEKAKELINLQQEIWEELKLKLNKSNIFFMENNKLLKDDIDYLEKIFLEELFPVLTPLAIDPAHPFPFLPNRGFGMMLQLVSKENSYLTAILPIPRKLKRFIRLNGKDVRFIRIEQVIELFISQLFPDYRLKSHGCFTVIRDSDIELEEEAEDLVRVFETALRKRQRGTVIRLKVDNSMNKDLISFLVDKLDISEDSVVKTNGIVALEDTSEVIIQDKPNLIFPTYNARFPERIREYGGDCFAAIKQKDILVHHPFESFDVVLQFIKQASEDKDVVAIKQTLYRTSDNSPIVKSLINAAEKGISVTALIELKARFDEENNIKWSRDLENAGVHVVYGFLDLKTHAKVSLVVRREENLLNTYVHFGTGNYHPITAKVYTDLSFFTAEPDFCQDASKLFNYLTGYAKPINFNKITISPVSMRDKIVDLIKKESKNSIAGKPSGIWVKMNSLVDPIVIDELYKASQVGVKINLIIRGICCLRPGVEGLSENIKVKSIIGRFLEHSRVICFGNGYNLPSENSKVFISSADWMPRNLDRRVEALIPILNKTVHAQILNQIMVANLNDNAHSWELDKEDNYYKLLNKESNRFSSHEYFMNNPSLSGQGKSYEKLILPLFD
ncbi:RNA degradosome polyphosphate kinase [Alphaproteobacteria bacterium]|nr:RNA degradosome polyphosphate kinase [Alphaproteobacteria bacterium]